MSTTDIRYHLQRTRRKYLQQRLAESGLIAAGIALLVFGLCKALNLHSGVSVISGGLCGVAFLAFRSIHLKLFQLTEEKIMHYINRQFPQLEESGDLLLIEDQKLTPLQQLQKLKSVQQFEKLYPAIRLPNSWKQSGMLFAISVLLFSVVMLLSAGGPGAQLAETNPEVANEKVATPLPASIENATITITPPAYTGLAIRNVNTFDLRLPEGSDVQWNLRFTKAIVAPYLVFAGHDSVSLTPDGNQNFSARRVFTTNGIYQVAWTNADGTRIYSDYFPIEVTIDQPPVVKVDNLNQFVELGIHDNPRVTVNSTITDDFGLRDAYIIATVSKGSGEAVKFREEKLRFTKPGNIEGSATQASVQLDVHALGLDPGDELYFYVETLDIKAPTANRSRTETFFITLLDTAAIETSVDPGLGVDLLPEYFRSQRQIIIDSEKLLREKKKIATQSFNSRSNELGYDQKVLRLRYGEFLGEEFETNIGPHAGPPEGDDDETDVTKKYGHVHDKDNDHNLVDEKKAIGKSAHDHDQHTNTKDEDPSKAYMHEHDSEDEATFFTQSIRAKLKAAVTIMWDAELYLRLYQPEKSLPFQYKALKLLKEISQDSRIYVHRTGFDPPPLKEEKRLTGDLGEIKNTTNAYGTDATETYPAIRKGAQYIAHLLQQNEIIVTPDGKEILVTAGQALSGVALKQPGRYLTSLSLLKAFTDNTIEPNAVRESLQEILASFYRILPAEIPSPQAQSTTTHKLDERFLKNLDVLNKE